MSLFIDIDVFRRWFIGQSGHTHDVACDGNNESGAGGNLDLPYRHNEIFRTSQQFRIVGKGFLRFCHTHR